VNLLNPSIEHYTIHEKVWESGSSEICNPQGVIIGKVKKKRISMKTEIQLLDHDETVICIISKKSIESVPIYDVKTPSGELIGHGKKAVVSNGKIADMYDSEENHIYKAVNGVTKRNFKVIDPKNKNTVYAEIESGNKWRDIFTPEFNFKNRYVIHIVDSSAPRLMLLAYAIIVTDAYHDE
jgi:uncharacterized protein YxjI